jgi:glycine oxidase
MASQERIAIVGGGIIGCAIASELARRGAGVTLFESGEIGGGATQASAGILAPYTEAHEGGALFELMVRGLAEYDDFVTRVRERSAVLFEYRRSGTVEVAEDPEHARRLKSRAGADLTWLDDRELRQVVPAVSSGALGGLHCPRHAYVGVRGFVAAVAEAARGCGARLETGAAVQRISPGDSSVKVCVRGDDQSFDRVILCAGAWTPTLDPYDTLRGRITPVRGQLLRLRATDAGIGPILWSRACYLVPWTDGTVLVGATSENAGFEVRATVEGVRDLLMAATTLVPGLASGTFSEVLVGLRPGTVDGIPILGPSHDPRVIHAAGHYRNGILLAPLTARLIADYVFTNAVDPSFQRT